MKVNNIWPPLTFTEWTKKKKKETKYHPFLSSQKKVSFGTV